MSERGTIVVPGAGPMDAKLLWVGESPGRTEERKGVPFVGMTGDIVRRGLAAAGMNPDVVRFNNAIPVRVESPTERDLEEHRGHLEADLGAMRPNVVVACGGVALTRLLGSVEKANITTWHGTVTRWKHESWTDGHEALLVGCTHPASVMRTKIQAERIAIGRVIGRVVDYVSGALAYVKPKPRIVHNPAPSALPANARAITVDTEYDPDTKRLLSIQLTYAPYVAYVIDKFDGEMRRAIAQVLNAQGVLKIAHNHTADVEVLLNAGIDVPGPWFDTMGVASALYPDLPVGLSHVSRFYLDNVWAWKELDTMDLTYRALDVHFAHRVYEAQLGDMATAGGELTAMFYDEIMPTLPLLWGMEERGMVVDVDAQRVLNEGLDHEIKTLRASCVEQAREMFTGRIVAAREGAEVAKGEALATLGQLALGMCAKHPTYTGARGKKFAVDEACTCRAIYEAAASVRAVAKARRAEGTMLANRAKLWERKGFDPGNNHHVRWLLYDKAALGLKVVGRRSKKTKLPSVNATAIAKLLASAYVQHPEVRTLITNIKLYQHAVKVKSTFANPPVDGEHVAHPPYRMQTGTGRVAGGEDVGADDVKGASEYAFNVLNIPDEVRGIYVPGRV